MVPMNIKIKEGIKLTHYSLLQSKKHDLNFSIAATAKLLQSDSKNQLQIS